MESTEEQIIIKSMEEGKATTNRSAKSNNAELRALLSIKKIAPALEKEYSGLLQIESVLDEAYKHALSIVESKTSPEIVTQWVTVSQKVQNAIIGINDTLKAAKEKISQKEKEGYSDLWDGLAIHLTALKKNSKIAATSGSKLLPEATHKQWEKEFVQIETPLVESLVIHADSCRLMMQMVENYTPDELNEINRMIAAHMPEDLSFKEAVDYQNDYNKALVNFKNEFKKEKNLWDRFLDILAGGTHQSPSERVMMERWVDGEEDNL